MASPVWVVIENQYRRTDHSHLGQLLTYAAHAAKDQENVLAVWITEDAHPAHLAAIEYLNRTSSPTSGVGYSLLQVRFAPAPSGYQVFFQVLASQNAFLQSPPAGSGTEEPRRSFMSAIYDAVKPVGQKAGANASSMEKSGWWITFRFPFGNELQAWPLDVRVLSSQHDVRVQLVASGKAGERNRAVLDVIKEEAGAVIEAALPPGTSVNWHAGFAGYATD